MKKNTLILLAIIIILVILAIFQGRRVSRLSDEVERQERNVEVLRDHERLYKICDSINVAEIKALELDNKQFNKLVREKDRQISEIQEKRKKDIEYYSSLAKTDTFLIDNTRIDTFYVTETDTCVGFMDDYVTYVHCNNETLITTRDTIKQVISKHYKHKFLWFRWGVDGITQDVWSTNPHSNIHFEEFIRIDD